MRTAASALPVPALDLNWLCFSLAVCEEAAAGALG
jgi:hypothetical protein